MTYYQAKLPEPNSTSTVVPITVGEYSFTIHFQWPDEIQEIWDEFTQSISALGANDPLVTPMGYSREYDYVQLYSSITNIQEWLASDEYKPLSIVQAEESRRTDIVQQRVNECIALKQYEDALKEHLKWTATVEDSFGERTVTTVEPGGWYRNQTDNYSFKFLSDKEYIDYDDLRYVSIMFRVVD